jgi:hypothetical protein
LKLSRVALARILDIDPATIYRQERGVMSALWDYATRGVEAEAKLAKPVLQTHQAHVDRRDLIADGMTEHGHPALHSSSHRGRNATQWAIQFVRGLPAKAEGGDSIFALLVDGSDSPPQGLPLWATLAARPVHPTLLPTCRVALGSLGP